MKEPFCKYNEQLKDVLTILAKRSIIDFWEGFGYSTSYSYGRSNVLEDNEEYVINKYSATEGNIQIWYFIFL